MKSNYFDNSATTEPCDYAVEAMLDAAKNFGNPSSLHSMGISAENILKSSRKILAQSLKVEDKCFYFTSCGTESNNTAIIGTAYRKKSIGTHIITTKIEHPSVLNAFKFLESQGWSATYLDTDKNGRVDLDMLKRSLTSKTVLVSMAHVNNEIGTVQPIEEVGNIIKQSNPRCHFHVDCVQSYMKIPIDLKKANVSLASFSAHKIHGFKGCGALYVQPGVNIDNIIYGGGQERGMRSGTENVAGIAAFGAAIRWNNEEISKKGIGYLGSLHDMLYDAFEECDNITLMCERNVCARHICSISARNTRGEVLLHALEKEGFFVSTGSACSSHKRNISHVLQATGTPRDVAEGVIRISLSYSNTPEEVRALIEAVKNAVRELEQYIQK